MYQLEGFVVPGQEFKVCKLIRTLYSLKQAPKMLHAQFYQAVLYNSFVISDADKCMYHYFAGGRVIICLYVDDILILETD